MSGLCHVARSCAFVKACRICRICRTCRACRTCPMSAACRICRVCRNVGSRDGVIDRDARGGWMG